MYLIRTFSFEFHCPFSTLSFVGYNEKYESRFVFALFPGFFSSLDGVASCGFKIKYKRGEKSLCDGTAVVNSTNGVEVTGSYANTPSLSPAAANLISHLLFDVQDMDNPSEGFFSYFIPSNVSLLSRMTQFMALLSYCVFADESLKDIVRAVETFPKFSKVKEGDKFRCMVFSCVLRFTQGSLATVVVLLLVMQTQDVIDIILNFTAVNFISGFDDIAFELAQWGKYGPKLKAEADRIEELTVPDCIYRKYDHIRYRYTILPIAIVLIILAASIAIGQNSDHVWLTQRLRVQFEDGSLFEDYSGCYKLDSQSSSWFRKRENYISLEANAQNATFGYCEENRKWILYVGNESDPCEAQQIAYSSKTYYFGE